MTIKLETLVSDLNLNTKGFEAGKKIALGVTAAVAAGVATVAATVVKAVDETFKWAGELDSLQDVMGITNTQAAALNFVLHKSGVETDTLTQGMTILEKGLVNTDGTLDATGKKLQEYGINVLDANGKVKDQVDLLSEISNKYNSFGTQQERINFLTDTFGKSGAKLVDVFDTLAQEGGLDKVTNKVEKFGLAIDPAKYEKAQRAIEEVKLGFLGVGVTIVDSLMPALDKATEWWDRDGVKTFTEIQTWLKTNIPIAIEDSKTAWASMTFSWNTQVAPNGERLVTLFTNINTILEKLSPSTDTVAGKFTLLGIIQREAVGWAMVVKIGLTALGDTLDWLNARLEDVINHWEQLMQLANHFNPFNTISQSLPSSGGTSSSTSGGGGGGTRRASGGQVIAGQTVSVSEFYKPEMFTPDQSGRIDQMQSQTIDENKIGDAVGRRLVRDLPPLLALLKA